MIKSNGGSGYLRNVLLQNFLARGTAYGLDVDQFWSGTTTASGDGVTLTNITFQVRLTISTFKARIVDSLFLQDWDGAVVDGVQRPPIQFLCDGDTPCSEMILDNVNLWSATDEAVNKCESAFGEGSCLHSDSDAIASYAITTASVTEPPGYTTPPTLSGDLSGGFATDSSIPIP